MAARLTRMDWTALVETARTAAEIWDRDYIEFLRKYGDPEGVGADASLRQKMKSELGERSDAVCEHVWANQESLKLCQTLRSPVSERVDMPLEIERCLAPFMAGPPREMLRVGPRSSMTGR